MTSIDFGRTARLRLALMLVLACTACLSTVAVAQEKVVFQVSDNDVAKWNLTLGNVRNLQAAVGAGKTDIEIVAYGPGLLMLKGDSQVASRVAEALGDKVHVVACMNTMRNMKLTEAEMLPNIGYVPSGVVEVMRKQHQGYAYIRP